MYNKITRIDMTENTAIETNLAGVVMPVDSVSEKDKERYSRRRQGRDDRSGGKREAREPKEFEETILQIQRVTRVVRGGRRMRFKVTVVIGDKKGRVGFGMGKSLEVMSAVQKAVHQAKKRLVVVPMYYDTIPHPVKAKFKAATVELFPAPAGRGIVSGGAVRKLVELAGIRDVLTKIHGSTNPIVVAYATIEAIKKLATEAPVRLQKSLKEKEELRAKMEAESPKPVKRSVLKTQYDTDNTSRRPRKTDK